MSIKFLLSERWEADHSFVQSRYVIWMRYEYPSIRLKLSLEAFTRVVEARLSGLRHDEDLTRLAPALLRHQSHTDAIILFWQPLHGPIKLV